MAVAAACIALSAWLSRVWMIWDRLETFQQHNAKWYSSAKALTPEEEFAKHKELLLRLCPIAFLFMFFVFGASTVLFALV
jgi:hypothetical protein